jgi:hypothetical protein
MNKIKKIIKKNKNIEIKKKDKKWIKKTNAIKLKGMKLQKQNQEKYKAKKKSKSK